MSMNQKYATKIFLVNQVLPSFEVSWPIGVYQARVRWFAPPSPFLPGPALIVPQLTLQEQIMLASIPEGQTAFAAYLRK